MKVVGPDMHMWFKLRDFVFAKQEPFGIGPAIKDSAVVAV